MAIDYGTVRTGIAVSDPLKMIANGLDTVITSELWTFLTDYFNNEDVEGVVIGFPKHLDNTPEKIVPLIHQLKNKISQKFPEIYVELEDERFTSKMAFQAMIDSGISKKARKDKSLIDKISATIILQSYLERKSS